MRRTLNPAARFSFLSKAALAALAACLALRWGVSLLTEFKPIFPDYYYTDARLYDKGARELLEAWETDSEPNVPVAPSHSLYVLSTAALYQAFGAQPLAPKLVNGLVATAAVFFWYRIALLLAPQGAAVLFVWMLALWPTNIFNSSQHFRTAPILLLTSLTFYLFLRCWARKSATEARTGRAQVFLALGALTLAFTGLYRPYVMALAAASLLTGCAVFALKARRDKRRLGLMLASGLWVLAGLALSRPLYSALAVRVIGREAAASHGLAARREPASGSSSSLPAATAPKKNSSRFSAEALSEFRHRRHVSDQVYARDNMNRKIGSQIFPDETFHSWWDVIVFIPKGTFYAALMPLPGLYPMQGKIGRIVASLENLVLLSCLGLALWGWRRARGLFPLFWTLAAFFCATSLFYGFFELDLGAASRHRLQHFPAVLLPAALALWHMLPSGLRRLLD